MKLHFLKTKWSDMIILESNSRVALVDTGFNEQYEQLSGYLKSLAVDKIDFILLTHFHRDHYGCISQLVKNFQVDTVYLKQYSGLDSTTAWGSKADDEYRESEKNNFKLLMDDVVKYSSYGKVEGLKSIQFDKYTVELYNTENIIQQIYEDPKYSETYKNIVFSENANSLAVFIEADGKTVFLGGDMMDYPSSHPLADYACSQVAKRINRGIDIYKAPHHGTVHTAEKAALDIFRPGLAVITNEDSYLSENSDVYANLKAANSDVKIMLTELENIVLDTE